MAARPPPPGARRDANSAPARRHGKVRPRRGANKTFLLRPGLRFCAPGQAAKNNTAGAYGETAGAVEQGEIDTGGRGMASEAARRQAKNRSYYQARQRCKYCGRQDARTIIGKPCCFDCLEKRRERSRMAYPKCADAHNAKCKARYEQRKADGICPACGNPVEDTKHVFCALCRAKKRARAYKKNHEGGMLSRAEKAERGICSNCNKPVMQGLNSSLQPIRLCAECYQKSLRSMATARRVQHEQGPNSFQEKQQLFVGRWMYERAHKVGACTEIR